MNGEYKPRHFDAIPGLVRRDSEDLGGLLGPMSKELGQEYFDQRYTTSSISVGRPKPENPSLVSSVTGSMDRVFLTIPNYAVRSLSSQYQQILDKIPQTTHLLIAAHEQTKTQVQDWIDARSLQNRTQIFSISDNVYFSIWAEDGYAISVDSADGSTYFVEPFSFPRYGDSLLADYASSATDIEDTQSSLYFQGGNILIGDDFFFIGSDYPANSLKYLRSHLVPQASETPADMIYRMYREDLDLTRTLHYVGSTIPVPSEQNQKIRIDGVEWNEFLFVGNKIGTTQPLFHIDMFISLAGRNKNGKYQLLVGDPGYAAKLLGVSAPYHAMQNVFDNIAKSLSQKGFEVIRNPLPLTYFDDISRKERTWYFATSNNVWVQDSQDNGKHVWLPTYGHGNWKELTVTDNENKSIWKKLGYTVSTIDDFHPFAQNLGALHCIGKYLQRDRQIQTS